MKKQTIKITAMLLAVMLFFCSCATTTMKKYYDKDYNVIEAEEKAEGWVGRVTGTLLGGGIMLGLIVIRTGPDFADKYNDDKYM